jgi:hypothetical protein
MLLEVNRTSYFDIINNKNMSEPQICEVEAILVPLATVAWKNVG